MDSSMHAKMLMDPKAMRKYMANCRSVSTHSKSRQISEPPSSCVSTIGSYDRGCNANKSKDDAHNPINVKGRKTSVKQPSPQAHLSHFPPQQLLDPKGFGKLSRQRETQDDSLSLTTQNHIDPTHRLDGADTEADDQNSHRPADNVNHGQSMGNLIERVHNVTQREEPPRKKQKLENTAFDHQKNATFAGGEKGGDIGAYMREKRKEGLANSEAVSSVVDLTGGDDEDVVFVSDSQEKEVCYGRLDGTKVHAHQLPCPSGKAIYLSKRDWPAMKLQLRRHPGRDQIIRVIDPMGQDFGTIDVRTSSGLARIMDSKVPKFRTQARLTSRPMKDGDKPGKLCSEYLDATINLYGPKNKAHILGRYLGQKNIFLRTPFMVDAGVEVHNPHQPAVTPPRSSITGIYTSLSNGSGTGYVTRTLEEIRSDVIGMFDSLEQSESLPEMDPDPRVMTELLGHQKQGLYFLTSKERARVISEEDENSKSLWRLKYGPNGQRTYYNIITGREEKIKPSESLGGILADMMGLGKTLSILSLIVGSLAEAEEWGHKPLPAVDHEKMLIRKSKTTLLVSPLSTVTNWEDQIAMHIQPGTLKYYVYHGGNRISDLDELAEYDIVITTYSIVASEFSGRGNRRRDLKPLLQTDFFRVVLDEAHMIREQSTVQSQAVCALTARRRWAVTGTPVQNRLDDLGALIKFLRVKPFDERGAFAQFILGPFKNSDPEIIPKLRLLVDSITLRRLKDRIDLPARQDTVVRLAFSEDEQTLYDWFSKDSQNKLQAIAGGQRKSLGGKSYVHILRAIMRLRLICAHGRELLSEDDLKITEGFSQDNAINLDDEDDTRNALSDKQAYEMLMLFRETGTDTCVQCTRRIEVKETEEVANGKNEVIGCMLPCYQILCKECMDGVKTSVKEITDDHHFKCPFCDAILRTSFKELTVDGIEAAEEQRVIARENPRQAKIMGRYGGPHTKVKALINALKESQTESSSLPCNEQPIKSVVFSGWTSNLDLIQIALEDNRIRYVRLDGKMSRSSRNASLEAFREDSDVCVILISITAGGLGLNLTSGSKVYVMEPQFNPAAEAQAIDRVHRLGQKREVFTYRFIMENSFEEKMLELQRKKTNLAELSMNRGKLDKAEAAKRKLDELRSLFK